MSESPIVHLRAIERADIPLFVIWFNDPEVTAGLGYTLPLSLAREEGWFEAMLKRPVEEQPLTIEVDTEEGWLAIGGTNLFGLDWHSRRAELGITIGDKRYWSRGCGTQAVRLMLKYAFETLNLHRLHLKVYADNPRAIRVYEKVGFVREGLQRQAEFKNGRYHDDVIMSILRDEFLQNTETLPAP